MSKNIVIKEGGTDYQFTAAKLKTNKVGGGTCLWVPEDEVSLGTKFISQNGTYKASDDGKYGFSQVTVNVSGAQGSVKSDGTPNINPIDPNDPDSKVNPGGPGTSVVGTDPVTGNDYIIGVDEDGQLVTTPVPSVIEITENPTKTDYNDGNAVDPTGLVATLKNNDGTTFTNENYPDGKIPISELFLPIAAADINETTGVSMVSELHTDPIKFSSSNSFRVSDGGSIMFTAGSSDGDFRREDLLFVGPDSMRFIVVQVNNSTYVYGISSSPYQGGVYFNAQGEKSWVGYYGPAEYSYTSDNKTVYFGLCGFMNSTPVVGADYTNDFNVDGPTAWTVWYGNPSGGKQTIPVQWKSPYDGRTLETNYQITVDGQGFSDDSGGSQSGGGTDIPGGGSSSDSGGSASGGGGNF